MKIAVRYYTKTGNTKRLAEAVAQAVGVEALPISSPVTEQVDVLFLGNSYYAFSIDPEVRSFIRSLDKSMIGKIVNFGSAAMLNSTYKKVKAEADKVGIPMDAREFHCKGEFTLDSTQQVRATAMHGKIADIVKASLRVSQHTFIVTFDNGLTSFLMCDEEGIILTHDVWLYSFSSSIPFQSARIFPDLEIVTAIPEGRPNELLIILEEGPDPIEPVFSSYYSNQAVSPSGQKAFMGTSDAFMILSIPENRVLNELPFYRDKFYFFDYDDTAVFTSDEEHVIIDKWIISLTRCIYVIILLISLFFVNMYPEKSNMPPVLYHFKYI